MSKKINISFNMGGFTFIQFVLWIIHYGDIIILPHWLVWLPCYIIATIIGIFLLVIIIVLIIFVIDHFING